MTRTPAQLQAVLQAHFNHCDQPHMLEAEAGLCFLAGFAGGALERLLLAVDAEITTWERLIYVSNSLTPSKPLTEPPTISELRAARDAILA